MKKLPALKFLNDIKTEREKKWRRDKEQRIQKLKKQKFDKSERNETGEQQLAETSTDYVSFFDDFDNSLLTQQEAEEDYAEDRTTKYVTKSLHFLLSELLCFTFLLILHPRVDNLLNNSWLFLDGQSAQLHVLQQQLQLQLQRFVLVKRQVSSMIGNLSSKVPRLPKVSEIGWEEATVGFQSLMLMFNLSLLFR